MPTPIAAEVLAAMITPAVLISASGTLVLSTSNRLTRVVDRVRVLAYEVEAGTNPTAVRRSELVSAQLQRLASRALLLRSALTALYVAIGLLVTTSVAVGFVALSEWSFDWIVVTLALGGALALLAASTLLIREGRLAVASTLEEVIYVREVAAAMRASKPPAEVP